jgi:hypothetical protein
METTLNIHVRILDKIRKAAGLRNISCSSMIVILLQRVMKEKKNHVLMARLVKYQKRRSKDEWRKFHITWRVDDYEYFLDLRKFRKMSVSHILAYAVEKYLKKLKRKDFTDNYRFHNYVIMGGNAEGVTCWKLFWGFPLDIIKHMQ